MSAGLTIYTRDLITLALKNIGVQGTGQPLSNTNGSLGLQVLNLILDACNAERALMFVVNRYVIPFSTGYYQYQIGPSATQPSGYGPGIVQDRPYNVQTWSVLLGSIGGNPPLELPHRRTLTADEYNLYVTLKTLTSTFPTALYYQPANPNGILNFWPVPAQGGNSMVLYVPGNLQQAANLNQLIQYPPGYGMWLMLRLARLLAPNCGRTFPVESAMELDRIESAFRAVNAYIPTLELPFLRFGGYYNWLTDEGGR